MVRRRVFRPKVRVRKLSTVWFALSLLICLLPQPTLAACVAPNGTYSGTLANTTYNLENTAVSGIDSLQLTVVSLVLTYNKSSTNPFGPKIKGRFVSSTTGSTGVNDRGETSLTVKSSSWDSQYCMGNFRLVNLDGSESTYYFSVVDSGATILGLIQGSTGTYFVNQYATLKKL